MRAAAAMLTTLAALALAAPASAAPALVKIGDFDDPVYVAAPPGDSSRLFVVEKPGRIQILVNGVKQTDPFLNVTAITRSTEFERGLLSMAFASDYSTSGRFFVYLTANQPLGQIQVHEFRRSPANLNRADPDPVRTVAAIDHDFDDNHNGGQLQVGPDGMLWMGTGDGGGANDPQRNAQNPASLLGKLLRIDPNQTAGPVIWSSGLRNPWRFSFDRQTGDLVIADVGQNDREEIDFAPASTNWGQGANYGWVCWEGTLRNSNSCNPPGHTTPVHERDQTGDDVCSITGGYVVRDPGLPTLQGRYIYGDYCNTEVRSLVLSDPSTDAPVGFNVTSLSSFGEDACGRVYAVSLNGSVYRIEDGASACSLPPPPPPPSQPPPVTDSPPGRGVKPVLRVVVSGRRTALARRRLRVAVSSDVAVAMTVTGRIRRAGTLRAANAPVPAGKRRVLTVRLRRAVARRLQGVLRRRGRAVVLLSVRARDAEGDVATARPRVTLRRR